MSDDTPSRPPATRSREERLAKALRENLGRRKALARAKRARTSDAPTSEAQSTDSGDGDASR
ncbi:MAG: hypothetical protein AB7J30_21110 [Hyphomicrobium sp.]|uniref:hypothetical protein n=1 Tax=Hyphomicrobium sp. TaxID=82 RepID=UPI003D13EC99